MSDSTSTPPPSQLWTNVVAILVTAAGLLLPQIPQLHLPTTVGVILGVVLASIIKVLGATQAAQTQRLNHATRTEYLRLTGKLLPVLLVVLLLAACAQLTPVVIQDAGLISVGEYLRGVKPPATQYQDAQLIYTLAVDVQAGCAGDPTKAQSLVDQEIASWKGSDPVLVLAVKPMVDGALQTALAAVSQNYSASQAINDFCLGVEEAAQLYIPTQTRLAIRNGAKARAP